MSETEPKIYKLLKETPPNGDRFAQFIKVLDCLVTTTTNLNSVIIEIYVKSY